MTVNGRDVRVSGSLMGIARLQPRSDRAKTERSVPTLALVRPRIPVVSGAPG
jgi:hypothetical protein